MEAVHGFDGHSFAVLLHIVLFAYWLGGDVGVYYASRYILKSDLGPEARAVSTKIMHGVDIAPRVSLVLILPSGVTLMAWGPLGDDFFVHGWLLALVWVASLAWLAVSVIDYRGGDTAIARLSQRADLLVRYALSAGLLAAGIYTMVATDPFGVDTNPKWLGAKVVAYALCIFCGVMIRRQLVPFGPAFGRLVTSGTTPEVERAILGSIRRCEPWVYGIWALVLLAAALGVIKPGSSAF
ncbi:hypothetical protein [Nocardioides sp. cx-173]|uniref:hypothetical protein n=1 Tax=Nocardioides sp. cx-173 TaxID=2898796 RepID=UPI001E33BD55|nr:hypothetical protein [Nocardioides sp. cx-173]MCD4524355.1 hypothetical protein [Nocardioides sp. cx-173]UGB43157.1 hypothetical protein LQ940_06420 [Nocardioides sp. cx-173]